MKKFLATLLLLTTLLQSGCTGSGAVNPLTPTKASQADPSMAASESDTIYWTSFPVTFGLTDSLTNICFVSKKMAWACGNNSVVLKYDGETWSKVDTGLANNQNFYAISFVNENEGWAVGSQGIILHYNNGNWTLDPSPTQENLFGIVATRQRTAWAVGSNGTILSYNGISWGVVSAVGAQSAGSGGTTVTNDIYSVGLSSQNNGWAVGNLGLILHYDGQKWQTFSGSPTTEKLNSVSVINDQQAWAVGAFGTILRYNGTTWSKVMNAFSGFDLYQIAMRSDDDGWAIGQDGTIIYYDGTQWISHQKPEGKPALNGIAFNNDSGFIVGQKGTILKFQSKGEPAKYDFMFKGEVGKKPSKTNPYWTFTYTLMNQSPKTSPPVTFELPLPKGFEPYKPAASTTPSAGVSSTSPAGVPSRAAGVSATPSAMPTPTPILAASTSGAMPVSAQANSTPGAKATGPKTASPVSGTATVKGDNLEWEVGTVAASEMKSITIMLQEKKKEKIEYPAILKAVLRSGDKVIAEAAPVTFLVKPLEIPIPDEGKAKMTPAGTGPAPSLPPGKAAQNPPASSDVNSAGNGPSNATVTPTPGS